MGFPFTPDTTFTDNSVPNVGAGFLNRAQAGINAAAIPAYGRIPFYAQTDNGTVVNFNRVGPFMAKDAVTSQYVGVPAASNVQITSGFLTSQWAYVYVRVSAGVVAYSVDATAPEATLCYKTGDETYRYLCAIWCDSFSSVRRFHAFGGPAGTRYSFHRKIFAFGNPSGGAVTTASWQTITGSGETSLPVTASIVRIYASVANATTVPVEVYFRGYNSGSDQSATGSQSIRCMYGPSTATIISAEGYFELFTNGSWDWSANAVSPNLLVRILIEGFLE